MKKVKTNIFSKILLFRGKSIILFWYILHYIFKHSFREKKYDVVFFSYTVYKKYKSKKGWVDVFLHPIVDTLVKMNYTYKIYEYNGDEHLKFPGHFPSCIIDFKIMKNLLMSKFSNHKINMDDSIGYIKSIERHLKENHDIELTISKEYIQKRTGQILQNSLLFHDILNKNKPKLVFTTSYTSWGYSLSLACNKLGIKCVDIQHGVQGNYSAKYGSWLNVPKEGYSILPQIFAVWDEHEYNVIQNWSSNTPHQPLTIGNMSLKLFPFDSETIFLEGLDKINVLITLQKTRDLTELMAKLLQNNTNKISWWIRIHPSMKNSEIKLIKIFLRKLNTNNYFLKEASETNLYSLLHYMDFHLTEFSSVTIEAAWFGVPTILTHKTGFDIYQNEINSGKAFYIYEAHKIIDKIFEFGKKKAHQNVYYDNKHEKDLKIFINSQIT